MLALQRFRLAERAASTMISWRQFPTGQGARPVRFRHGAPVPARW